ncbi:hypothetical protein [Faucicola atlantae]|uniref:hypothetical protein n=1 Tax=Faucicola atlantae TaxID=34059 RepID=UPI0025B055A0|nr:hypothetical protein [Moraxella atlantae]
MSAIISFVDFATRIPDVRRGACSVWGTKFGLALACLIAPALGFAGLPPNAQNPMPTYAQKIRKNAPPSHVEHTLRARLTA